MQKSIFACGRLSGPHAKITPLFFFSPLFPSSPLQFFSPTPLLSLRSSPNISLLSSPSNPHGRHRATTPTRRPAIGCGSGWKAIGCAAFATTGGQGGGSAALGCARRQRRSWQRQGLGFGFFLKNYFFHYFLIFICGPRKHPHENLIFACRYSTRMKKS